MASISADSPETQSLQCSFTVPGRHLTTVSVTLGPNQDPLKSGSCLLFPSQPPAAFKDFPMCNATVTAYSDYGYAAMYGWIQMVRESPLHSTGPWEMDLIPISETLDSPLIYFGTEPTLFDAPFRINRTDMDWTAWSFLTYLPDCLMTQKVHPVLVFEWGFRVEGGEVSIETLKMVDVREAWEVQRGLMEERFPGWRFGEVDGEVVVGDVSRRTE